MTDEQYRQAIKDRREDITERLLLSGQDAAVFKLAGIADDAEWLSKLLEMAENGEVVPYKDA